MIRRVEQHNGSENIQQLDNINKEAVQDFIQSIDGFTISVTCNI